MNHFFQPVLVLGGTGSSVSVVSQPVQPGRGRAQSPGVGSHQHRVNATEARAARGPVNASE